MISPSGKTDVTDIISPTSMYSLPLSNASNKKENCIEAVNIDDMHDVRQITRFKDLNPHGDINTEMLSDPEYTMNRNNEKGKIDEEGNNVLDRHHYADLLTSAENFVDQNQIMKKDFIEISSVDTNYSTQMDNSISYQEILPNTHDRYKENPSQSVIQPSGGANGIMSDNCDHFESYQVHSKPDAPPLLAPPKNVTVVTCPSNTEKSVKPAIIANFNRMKKQAKKASKQERGRRQEEKIRDRRRDIQGYIKVWEEYNEIKERVTKQREKKIESSLPNKEGDKIALKDSTTWYVDFSTLNSINHLEDKEVVNYIGTPRNEVKKSQTKLSLLIESTVFSQNSHFELKELPEQHSLAAEPVGRSKNHASAFSHSRIHEPTLISQNNHDRNVTENGRNNNTAVGINLDLENRSMTSDLENGSNLGIMSSTNRSSDDDDYGVLNQYSRKSIEVTVPTHTENFNAHLGNLVINNQTLEDPDTCLSTADFRNENSTTLSFSKYLANNCLPSVSIENAETGQVRWRRSSENDTRSRRSSKD